MASNSSFFEAFSSQGLWVIRTGRKIALWIVVATIENAATTSPTWFQPPFVALWAYDLLLGALLLMHIGAVRIIGAANENAITALFHC